MGKGRAPHYSPERKKGSKEKALLGSYSNELQKKLFRTSSEPDKRKEGKKRTKRDKEVEGLFK